MQVKNIIYGIALGAILITSCQEAKNNPVFATAHPSSSTYKAELSKQLKAYPADGLTYIVNKYLVVDGKEYLELNIKGKDMDASGLVYVNNWTNMEQLRKNKGAGYNGAELKGVQLTIGDTNLSLHGVTGVID